MYSKGSVHTAPSIFRCSVCVERQSNQAWQHQLYFLSHGIIPTLGVQLKGRDTHEPLEQIGRTQYGSSQHHCTDYKLFVQDNLFHVLQEENKLQKK